MPSTMPTEIAAHGSTTGWVAMRPAATRRVQASCRATHPPQIDAVRVPPSAWRTSQSTRIWRSPRAAMSTTARSDRPISRWISCVRPDGLPSLTSRRMRSGDEPGSIEYSAVTQPLPVPRIQRGTSSSTDAVHSTRVRPKVTSTEPSAMSVKSRSKVMGRSSSTARPSAVEGLAGPSWRLVPLVGAGDGDRAAEGGFGFERGGPRGRRSG